MDVRDKLPPFTGFGDSILDSSLRRPVVQLPLETERERCRSVIRQMAPTSPGIYGWVDRNQRLLYVGKSKSLRHRLLSYFDKTPADDKTERMRHASSRIVWEPIAHELLALIREQELIYRWRPSFNRMGQPERRKPGFLCVSRGAAPRVFFAHQPLPQAELCVGPVIGVSELREAIEQLNFAFGLRDCSDRTKMQWSNQLPLFHDDAQGKCLRFELQSCIGPCSGSCRPSDYRRAVQEAIAFLRGEDDSILNRLADEQRGAVNTLRFERAGVLQRRIESLSWLARRLESRRRSSRELSGAYPITTFANSTCWMLLDRGYITGFSGSAVTATPHPIAEGLTQPSLALEWMLIVGTWFRRNVDQKRLIERVSAKPLRKRASA